jgi:hypothetical protein
MSTGNRVYFYLSTIHVERLDLVVIDRIDRFTFGL